jgi:uncharacterized protein (DUF2062 family)
MLQRIIDHLCALWMRFMQQRDRPHAMAGGLSIGFFFGFIPTFGLKTVLTVGGALFMRCNVIAAIVGVTLHDLFFWTWPFLFRLEFQIGHWILSHPHAFAPKLVKADFRMSEILQWNHFIAVGLPLLVGSIVIALPLSLLMYVITLLWMHQRQKSKARVLNKTN